MKNSNISFNDWADNNKETIQIKVPENIEEINFSYDGGRICLTINGKEVFYTALGGNDCSLNIKF